MTSRLAEPSVVLGAQEPRIAHWPVYESTSGDEAVELAQLAGLHLDEWQQFVLRHSLGERADGSWAAKEVGVTAPRQNGKDGILEARSLAGLFLLGERLITHSAHQFDTSLEAFRRLLELIENTPDLDRLVKRVSRSHGEEGIEIKGGHRIRFRTRTKKGGRGFSGDLVILNEAMELTAASKSALFFTISARPNPQVWYAGSPVDQLIHEHGVEFARVRERGLTGEDPRLAYFEWSIDRDRPDEVEPEVAADPEAWAQANPALGIRITLETIEDEHRSMDPRSFAVERLGVGDWPATDDSGEYVIDPDAWEALIDVGSTTVGQVCFSFDVTPDRGRAAIGVAGRRRDGHRHTEIVEHKRGTAWVAPRLAELTAAHDALAVRYDERSPAASLVPEITESGVTVEPVAAKEHAQACGHFYDTVVDRKTLRHLGTPELEAALKGAARRDLGDAWGWSRKSSGVDISPLVTVTLALWGLDSALKPKKIKPRFRKVSR